MIISDKIQKDLLKFLKGREADIGSGIEDFGGLNDVFSAFTGRAPNVPVYNGYDFYSTSVCRYCGGVDGHWHDCKSFLEAK